MRELMITLDVNTEKCLYEQIYDHIIKEIREGKLFEGEKLPSTRYLANYLQISRSTVETAYDQLRAEGYIISKPQMGYYVSGAEELLQIQNFEEPHMAGEEEEQESIPENQKESKFLYDFAPHGIDMNEFPFPTWKRITGNTIAAANNKLFELGNYQGDRKLRETIGRYLHSARGVNCTPEQIILGAGNDYLLLLLEKILGNDKKIAIETPSYMRAYKMFATFGWEIDIISMDEQGMEAKELRKSNADIAYVMPSHQFPTGVVMPITRRLELLKWAADKEGRYLIEDDYDSEFRYRGKPIPSLQASDRYGKVIYLGTFSKSIAPAIRISYMVLPVSLLDNFRDKCGFYASTVSRIDQGILNTFIEEGYFERYVNKMRKRYREKHDLLLEELRPFKKRFRISGENAGLHMLLTDRSGKTEEWLIKRAREAGVKVYGISEACPIKEKAVDSVIIIGYGGLQNEEIKKGIELLKSAWEV